MECGMTTAEIDALNEQAWDLCDNDARQALELSLVALQRAEQIGYFRGQACALRNSGVCRCSLLDYDAALAELLEALRMFREMGDPAGEAIVLNSIGKIHFRLNSYPDALDC